MPRPPRVDHEGAWHHVMNRGAGRSDIFNDDEDRACFLDCLHMASQPSEVDVHGYCLMRNHYHLLVFSRGGRLSAFMRLLAGRYTRLFNRRWHTDGPIFRGLYHSVSIESDAHLVATSRYIHLNPVMAGLVDEAERWIWSSAAQYLEPSNPADWLHTSTILDMFAGTGQGTRYREFLRDGIDEASSEFYAKLRWE